MKLPPLDYACPATISEAVALLARYDGEARPISGGQSLMPILAFRMAAPTLLVDLRCIPGLDRITIDADGVTLGAKVRWCDIEEDALLRIAHPLLQAAVAHVAHYQVRNRGTVGGSLAHADPAAELPAVALACDAVIEVAGPYGERSIAARDFFLGALSTALEPAELIVRLRLPAWTPGRRFGFQEFARRRGDFALAGAIVAYDVDAGGRIAAPSVCGFGIGETPQRISSAEAALLGQTPGEVAFAAAADAALRAIDPPDDLHADARYRRALFGGLLSRALAEASAP